MVLHVCSRLILRAGRGGALGQFLPSRSLSCYYSASISNEISQEESIPWPYLIAGQDVSCPVSVS
jgi:hypothetical protein